MAYPRAIKPNYGLDVANMFAADLGAPALAVTNRIVTTVNMKVGAYTIANAASSDSLPRNVTCTVSKVVENDTMGTIVVVGTDPLGVTITETLTPNNGDTSAGLTTGVKTFKTVTSVTGVGWVSGGTPDTIVVGFGKKIGFPSRALFQHPPITAGTQVFAVMLGGETVAASIAFDADVWQNNSIDASTATYDATKRLVALVLR